MNSVHRAGECLRLRALRPSSLRLGVLMFAGIICAAGAAIQAAPVTFRFEAEIASVIPPDGGLSLPFEVSSGDSIIATFTFEPTAGGPDFPQTAALRFELAGNTVLVPAYTIAVRDEDVPNATDLTGRIADPENTPIVDLAPGSSDNISVTCVSSVAFCGSLEGNAQLQVRPIIHLSTDDNPLSDTSLVADVNVWNQFSFREMSLTFSNPENGGIQTYIGAYIGVIHQVPEPGTFVLALIGTAALAMRMMTRLQFGRRYQFRR